MMDAGRREDVLDLRWLLGLPPTGKGDGDDLCKPGLTGSYDPLQVELRS